MDWSHLEVETAVADYFEMLFMELSGIPYNKKAHNRQLREKLNTRTPGSVERKHQNISAVLIELGYPYIDGYKPYKNYQTLLKEVVEDRLASQTALDAKIQTVVEATPPKIEIPADILGINVPPPAPEQDKPRTLRETEAPTRLGRRNYLEIESRNSALGAAGEELVIRFEHERLWRSGHKCLANKITHVSKTLGDSLGYDIQSYEHDGRDRLIEVKTTRFGALTPFFASQNEVQVSQRKHDSYQLYRVFAFSKQPKLFILPGALQRTCDLTPISFQAQMK